MKIYFTQHSIEEDGRPIYMMHTYGPGHSFSKKDLLKQGSNVTTDALNNLARWVEREGLSTEVYDSTGISKDVVTMFLEPAFENCITNDKEYILNSELPVEDLDLVIFTFNEVSDEDEEIPYSGA